MGAAGPADTRVLQQECAGDRDKPGVPSGNHLVLCIVPRDAGKQNPEHRVSLKFASYCIALRKAKLAKFKVMQLKSGIVGCPGSAGPCVPGCDHTASGVPRALKTG